MTCEKRRSSIWIRELEIVERCDALGGFDLCVPKLLEPRCVLEIIGDEADRGVTRRRLGSRRHRCCARAEKKGRRGRDGEDEER